MSQVGTGGVFLEPEPQWAVNYEYLISRRRGQLASLEASLRRRTYSAGTDNQFVTLMLAAMAIFANFALFE